MGFYLFLRFPNKMPIFCLNRTQFALLPFSQFLAAVMRHEAAS